MNRKKGKTSCMIDQAADHETIEFSLWSLPKEKWADPLISIEDKNLNSDIDDISERLKTFGKRLKPFETPVSLDALNKLIK